MTYIVTDNCIQCKYTNCVTQCPVDCFYEGPNYLVIHPGECIDCDACVEACPANAIFSEDDLPDDKIHFLELNEELSLLWPQITEHKAPLPEAEKWDGVAGKLKYLIKKR